MASEIEDKATWTKIVRTFTPGLLELIAILEPEAIVIGGGAGHYLDRFHDLLVQDMKQYETPMLQIPPILPAKRPDEAVLYGCYDYARQKYA
jgi:predicted NBD/HSP70 family sugar kinase